MPGRSVVEVPAVEPHAPAEMPSLLDQLRRDGFHLVPNYDRPLDDRVVDTRLDLATGKERDVTEYEFVAGLLGVAHEHREDFGRQIRQTWRFTVDDVRLRFNEFWEDREHHGVQYASICWDCGGARWNNADQSPNPRCTECHQVFRGTPPQCPEFERACSYAYVSLDCRCEACRAWKVDQNRRSYSKRRQRMKGPVSNILSTTKNKEEENKDLPSVFFSSTKDVTYWPRTEPRTDAEGEYALWLPHNGTPATGWPWLPESVRSSLARYQEAVAMVIEQEDA